MKANTRSNPSRRTVLSLMAATGAAWIAPEALFADDIDPRVSAILAKNITVDMHSHAAIGFVAQGEADPKDDPILDLEGEQKRSGFAALCYTYPVDVLRSKKPNADELYNAHLQALNQIDRILARQKMRRVFNLKQLEAAHKKREPVIIQAAEGAQFVAGHLDRVEEGYRRGIRHLQLVHSVNDLVSPLGELQTDPSVSGLTPFGADVVKECNRLHMVMDLAHAGLPMVKGVIGVTTQPFVVSHTALNSPASRAARESQGRDSLRLVTPEHAKAVADAGGIVGVWHLFPSLKAFVDGVKEMVDVIGVDHVGIGTDTYMAETNGKGSPGPGYVVKSGLEITGATNNCLSDLHTGFLYGVANQMLKQGFTPEEVGKIAGGNYCKLFGKVIGDRV